MERHGDSVRKVIHTVPVCQQRVPPYTGLVPVPAEPDVLPSRVYPSGSPTGDPSSVPVPTPSRFQGADDARFVLR